ncbi:MAG: ERAP1-like C-terminal domain-containing protein, partial [Desertimonas sp.]
LTYQKGGALLRMLEQYLGADEFRAGVSHYLRTHEYGNTETNDLWDAIETTSGEPVRAMMDSWIWQPGYPLVTAALDGSDLVLRQQRFDFGDAADGTDTDAAWLVPVLVRTEHEQARMLLDDRDGRLTLSDAHGPIVVNAGGHGFFRVAYDAELRSRLSGATLAGLDTLERYNLVDDAWNEVVAGRLSAADYLDFVEGFGAEVDLAVWQAILVGLRGIGRLLDDTGLPAFRSRVRTLLAPALGNLGDPVAGEDDLRAKLRGALTGALAVLGDDSATIARSRALYDHSVERPGSVDPELVSAATSVTAATGDAAVYDRLLAGYRDAVTPQDQLRHLMSLAEFDDEALVLRTCELAMSGEVKTQNAPFLLAACIANRNHGVAAWRFVRQHWPQANEAFPSNTIVRMVSTVRLLNTPEVAADVQSFFAEHPIPQAAKTLEQVLERQRVNTALRVREQRRLAESLTARRR